ncbi:hypothetical protein [Granulicella arctica]|uniref:hypothetical protein n=1 Tax=Granulicella arctica TaxID=940613 RepID=UPI0021DF8011|nr:hypothetical protein [Granulicella arctica]
MNGLKYLALAACAGLVSIAAAPVSQAQISINIGTPPSCPYGYYDYAPYSCSPYGYYGPEWFSGGAFIGAGRWFHGPANFHGHVNNQFDTRHGYHGPIPKQNEHPNPSNHLGDAQHAQNFHGNESHDNQGHVDHDRH